MPITGRVMGTPLLQFTIQRRLNRFTVCLPGNAAMHKRIALHPDCQERAPAEIRQHQLGSVATVPDATSDEGLADPMVGKAALRCNLVQPAIFKGPYP